jgi:putative ABC transport system permease protein
MSWLRLFCRKKADAELQEEITAHLAAEMEENIARGMSEDESWRQARIKFGNRQRVREALWQQNSVMFVENLWQDLRYSLRQIIKMPGFTLTAILSLALGIGATAAVFSVIYGVFIDPYPYVHSDRMFHLRLADKDGFWGNANLTGPQWQEYRKSPLVEDSDCFDERDLTVAGTDFPEEVEAGLVSSNAFQFLGVPMALGRGIEPSDAIFGQDPKPVIVLGHKLWQRYFGGNPDILGKTIQLSHQSYTVVGVAAPRFTLGSVDLYLPLKLTQDSDLAYYVMSRLKPGVTLAQAQAALTPLIAQFAKETPRHFPESGYRFYVEGLNEQFVQRLGGTIALLFGAVVMLLLIGCGNVSILLLARATARQHEFAVRAAIGANRARIVRQLLTESLLLALAGAGLGVLLAYKSLAAIVASLPGNSFAPEVAIRINLPVLLFSVAVAVTTGLLFGLWPAMQLARTDAGEVLQSTARRIAGGARGRRIHNALIAGQIALTLLMLAGSGAAMEAFIHLLHTPLGYDPHNVLALEIPLREGAYKSWDERAGYFEQLRASVAQVPGVTMAAISTTSTPPNRGFGADFQILGQPTQQDQSVRLNLVSPGYFPLLRVPFVQGQVWTDDENQRAAPVAVVNQTFVRKYLSNREVLGQAVDFPIFQALPPRVLIAASAKGWIHIVGVIADKRDNGLSDPILPEVFVPSTIAMGLGTQILVRSQIPPLTLVDAVRHSVVTINPDQPVDRPEDLEQIVRDQPEWARGHLIAWLFGAFACLALALAAVGLYSVVSYSVAQRTNEFGIRIALGARREHVLMIVLRSALKSVGGGIAAGVVLTLVLSGLMTQWSSGEASTRNPLLLIGSVVVLSLTSVLACAVPARRAVRMDPASAIRTE